MVFVTRYRFFCIFLLVFGFIIFILLFAGLSPATANSIGLLWINPVNTSIDPGGSAQVVLQLDNITNVNSALVSLTFDPSVIAVVDSDPGTGGVQISAGTCPSPNFIITNVADNVAGTIDYAVSQLTLSPPCSGGDVATIEFQCTALGTSSDVSIAVSTISDLDGIAIVHVTQNGSVTCLEDTSSKIYLPLIIKD